MNLEPTGSTITTPATQTRRKINGHFAILKHKRQLLTILVLLLICVITWAIVSLFSSAQKSKVDPPLLKLSEPLTPSLDLETLNTLESKRSFTEEELAKFPIYRVYIDEKSREERVISIDEPIPTTTPRPTTRPSVITTPTQQN